MAAIYTENLTKVFTGFFKNKAETQALNGLSLEVKEGETFGFLGPNGAGKTTTILLLLNLIRPTSGVARLFDQPVSDAAVHRRLGYLPESVNLHNYYTGRKLLEFYAALVELPVEKRASRITELLRLLHLEDAADKSVTKYSKGMLQRLGFAQAMLHDPDLLILDEPTASLDPVGRKEFRDILVELKARGKTIFISSHILSEVESVCDRVAILQKGELKKVGTLTELSSVGGSRLVCPRLPGAVMDALASTAAEISMIKDQVTIKCADAAMQQRVEGILQQHGIQPERVETETQSLEDIFFSTIEAPPRI
jgi:ABC-2 type transport system ATP-binding protein